MKLTRAQAIAGHRKMWTWIADETEKTGRRVTKREYITKNNFNEKIMNDCFCCEYVHQINGNCSSCPINWRNGTNIENDCLDGLYLLWLYFENDPKELARLAREISNLPVNVIADDTAKIKTLYERNWGEGEE